jgi:hypothetical protein
MRILVLVPLLFILFGCKSEVDKCVEVGLKAYDFNDEKQKSGTELNLRMACLRASSGK